MRNTESAGESTDDAEGTGQDTGIGRRDTAERRRDIEARLGAEHEMWVATAHPEHGPHQVPLWFLWYEEAVWLCTTAASATARNVRAEPRVRLALPDAFDVVLLHGETECHPAAEVPADAADAFAAKFGWDPRTERAPFVYLRIAPRTIRAWHGEPELRGRVILRDGKWLD